MKTNAKHLVLRSQEPCTEVQMRQINFKLNITFRYRKISISKIAMLIRRHVYFIKDIAKYKFKNTKTNKLNFFINQLILENYIYREQRL